MKAVDGSAGILPHPEAVSAGLEVAGPDPDPPVEGAQSGGPTGECWAACGHFSVSSLLSLASDNCLLLGVLSVV